MLCEKCKKKDATVFYEETINGKTRSYSLCGECAAAMKQTGEISLGEDFGGNLFGASPFGSLSDNLFGSLFGLPEVTRTSRKLCPLCHSSFEDLRRSGKAGCPSCYQTFAAELENTIRSIHGNVKHIGRAPSKVKAEPQEKSQLETLREELSVAISEENFERAATLRDEIRALETEGGR